MKTIVFTVTNDLSYDQRMQRICTSLVNGGYNVLLIGRKLDKSVELKKSIFRQKRLYSFFNKNFLFYAEYNLRLFFYLLFVKMDAVCAIDLDTILPCYFISVLRKKKRIYDAHELFTEMKEVITDPFIKRTWMRIEKFSVPKFKAGYTVSHSIAEEFIKRYDVLYDVIQNVPVTNKSIPFKYTDAKNLNNNQNKKIILYQGAVNEARGLENLVDAMKYIDATLHIYGDGNIFDTIKRHVYSNGLQDKIILKGKVLPETLKEITQNACIGINLVEPLGLNQLYSLANKFFDYMHADIPQVTMNFPEYKKINDAFEIAVLINTTNEAEITQAINLLLKDNALYKGLKSNCAAASAIFNWDEEEKKLLSFYKNLFTL